MKKKQTIPKLKAKLEIIFNAWIRERDKDKPCISCGQYKQLEAGHYFAKKGYDGIRFDEINVNGECHHCNCFDESHLIGYGENLEKRVGKKEYEALKKRAKEYKLNTGFKWNRSELLELIEKYK